ncbi:sarcosine oxidase subunit gamma [Aureimonas endophytica]|uniref:Sarcosine oxidase subunit gamma n=1 Tax=Aureimonas endophytica TaxID=2027858 RepID=A0A917A338_9HYPH|nr:sarcosine oxidase subunit gamma family protein [Aureimonas endophytica]GGE24175.1 sarcosine oxidase subunit gamma [Aureimonas endophytica]
MVEVRHLPAIRALSPLDGHYHGAAGLALTPAPARTLISLHLSESAAGPVGAALGLALPNRPKTSAEGEGLAVLWLGPDDLLLLAEEAGDAAPAELVARIEASGSAEQSAVDVSDRFVAIALDGWAAEAVLASGCPQDLRLPAFPVGAVSRSVLARAEIVLWRRSETRFELFCGRSFADYVWDYLVEATRAPAL